MGEAYFDEFDGDCCFRLNGRRINPASFVALPTRSMYVGVGNINREQALNEGRSPDPHGNHSCRSKASSMRTFKHVLQNSNKSGSYSKVCACGSFGFTGMIGSLISKLDLIAKLWKRHPIEYGKISWTRAVLETIENRNWRGVSNSPLLVV